MWDLTKREENVLYFDDRSDYKTALWEIIAVLNPNIDCYKKLEYIES